MGSGATRLAIQGKQSLMMSKQRITYKLNQLTQSVYTIKSLIEEKAREAKLDSAKIHTRDLLNTENNVFIATAMISYIDNLLQDIEFLNETKINPKVSNSLNSLIFASVYVQIEELEKFKEVIKKKFGKVAIDRAINDWDGQVYEEILIKTKKRTVTDQDILERLIKLAEEKNIDLVL